MIISKTIEFDMGHRIPYHKSKCKSPHGHRYKLTAYLEGDIADLEGKSDHGMVMDFKDVKKILMKYIHDDFDHGFMYWEKDEVMDDFFKKESYFNSIKVPFTPTAENIVAYIFKYLDEKYKDIYDTGLKLYKLELWETPTCKAVFRRIDDVPWK
tara:strand:- start:212 stop:673 length:462 start_codon:yes stop_codon:yes gene_type:complete